MEGHESCVKYNEWKRKHPSESTDLIRKADAQPKSVYISKPSTIIVDGNEITIGGGIKSLNPPCKGIATTVGEHPYTCDNCAKQLRDLKDTIRHRKSGKFIDQKSRVGKVGFNTRYARVGEMRGALDVETERRKSADKQLSQLVSVKLSPFEWENHLLDVCSSKDEMKLIVDLMRLFKKGISKTQPFQILVIRNLVSKLLRSNNHHYVDLIKDVSGLFKNELGPANYSVLSTIFGLARETTAANHSAEIRLNPGFNREALDRAAEMFDDLPVNEASDGARALRYIQPFLAKSGNVVLLGKSWNPDVNKWAEEIIPIPRRSFEHGDKDDFTALKRTLDEFIAKDQLSKSVSVHTLVSLSSLEKPTVIYCMWPEPSKGHKACHLLMYWEYLRQSCFYNANSNPRSRPIRLMGYSTDSAGFSLAASIQLMTPTSAEVNNGVVFLGLGTEDERFLSPYYWSLPSIAYLDYDHEQRLFLKNLKYETRDLTFWEEKGQDCRIATINHLKDLRHRCQKNGLECGFSATDLNLIYFFDQNSDACERLFTTRVADLLDEYVPGSHGTSLYIRAVYHLVEPYRNPAFGSPFDVQRSVSCAIIIFRLWRRVIQLKKMRLHSLPGAKNDPSKRGKFLTYGCYETAEVQFAAATLHQLAMFLHFNKHGPEWASPCCSGTKATERVISEMQGKTNEIQSLDAQPTYVDMLQRSSKVQFNLNAKCRLAQAGVPIKISAKRRRIGYALKRHTGEIKKMYQYPKTYLSFRSMQKQAHLQGVKDGQALFEKYMPKQCVQLLKESGYWERPYAYSHPEAIQVMDGNLPEDYNKLHTSFSYAKQEEVATEEHHAQGVDEIECVFSTEDFDDEDKCALDEEEMIHEESDEKERKWKISKRLQDGSMSYIHIRQAIKLLLPREYIARCRQKRHWASKYLPGRTPIDPNDIVIFSDVAIKCLDNSIKSYEIGRIEALQSVKDGSDRVSFQLAKKGEVRFRCSLYLYCQNDQSYQVPKNVKLTGWKSSTSIVGPVQLIADPSRKGCYSLHQQSRNSLEKLGFSPRGTVNQSAEDCSKETDDFKELEDGFYEVEDILERRLNKEMLNYEYKVRFKGYGAKEDMWLPSSCFNRAIHFETTSRFGRKRKHVTEAEDVVVASQNIKKKSKIHQPSSTIANDEYSKINDKRRKIRQMGTPTANREKKKSFVKKEHKGLEFRQSLTSSVTESREDDSQMEPMVTSDVLESRTSERRTAFAKLSFIDEKCVPLVRTIEKGKEVVLGKNVRNDTSCDQKEESLRTVFSNEYSFESNVIADLLKETDDFHSGRRNLSNLPLPTINPTLINCKLISDINDHFCLDPFTVCEIPPLQIVNKCKELLRHCRISSEGNKVVSIESYGFVDQQCLTVIGQYHRFLQLRREVEFEKRWIEKSFIKQSDKNRKAVEEALFNNRVGSNKFLLQRKGSKINSQVLSTLCGERYLSDETINVLLDHYCFTANEREKSQAFVPLPCYLTDATTDMAFLSTGVERTFRNVNIDEVQVIFLPVHIQECHWGLGVIALKEGVLKYDDGYHLSFPSKLKSISEQVLNVLQTMSSSSDTKKVIKEQLQFRRLDPPMPNQVTGLNQKQGQGSCGVGVLLCARDICLRRKTFDWTFDDASFHRAELMVEIVQLAS